MDVAMASIPGSSTQPPVTKFTVLGRDPIRGFNAAIGG